MNPMIRPTIFETKYYWTWKDLMKIYKPAIASPYSFCWIYSVFREQNIVPCIAGVIIKNFDYNWDPITAYSLKDYISELFQKLYARYFNEYIFVLDINDNDAQASFLQEKRNEFYNKIGFIIDTTYDRYSKLLATYNSELSKLLDGVKSTTTGVGRFNDTPQNITDGDEFGDNTHITNITKSTAEAISDADTKMNRIDEIQRKLRNIWKDWIEEFDDLFIERGNVE